MTGPSIDESQDPARRHRPGAGRPAVGGWADVRSLVGWAAKALVTWMFVALLVAETVDFGLSAARGSDVSVHPRSFDGVTQPTNSIPAIDLFVLFLGASIASVYALFQRTRRDWRALIRQHPRVVLVPRAILARMFR